jgi:hypothetical protein
MSLRKIAVGLFGLSPFLCGSAIAAEAVVPTYELETMVAEQDSKYGLGMTLVFQVADFEDSVWQSEAMVRDMTLLCKSWSPTVLKSNWHANNKTPPQFIKIMVKQGGVVGKYLKIRFNTDGQHCFSIATGK